MVVGNQPVTCDFRIELFADEYGGGGGGGGSSCPLSVRLLGQAIAFAPYYFAV